jgi:methyltransferase (TIGR00027 family)
MKPGVESQTAVMVCMGRAAAHGTTPVTRFQDPTAYALLPEEAQRRVENFRLGQVPRGWADRFRYEHLARESMMMVARTVAIDEAVRGAPAPQLVILGAGLDGRAWRMSELEHTVAFEVDHPDSQRQKRARVAGLKPAAKEVRFVPVDFAHDDLDNDLDSALAAAGHDPSRPTIWIWEGVVMYLRLSEIEASLRVIQQRSAPSSRLIVAYHSPALLLLLAAVVLRGMGEPIRSAFKPERMRALLARHGLQVLHDEALPAIGATLSEDVGRSTKIMKHLRIATADVPVKRILA